MIHDQIKWIAFIIIGFFILGLVAGWISALLAVCGLLISTRLVEVLIAAGVLVWYYKFRRF